MIYLAIAIAYLISAVLDMFEQHCIKRHSACDIGIAALYVVQFATYAPLPPG